MVKALHRDGIEVILDVVYNHTAEGNHLGPMLSLQGRRQLAATTGSCPTTARYYMDFTGTGNSLNVIHPSVLRLIMDSLRYWVTECHVDGFRFDLASALARELYDVDRLSAFFDVIHQDPVLSQVKLIAEPWDVGPGGYQVGNFPILLDRVERHLPRHDARLLAGRRASAADFAERLAGSSDLYATTGGGRPRRSTSSPRTTASRCADLVSYNEKHNEANLEDNRDGTDDNRSWNCGAEGPTDDPRSASCAARQQRNLLTTLLLSQGVPMILGGDEMGRTPGRQQQRLVPGQRDLLVRLGPRRRAARPARLHPPADRPAPGAPGVPPPPVPGGRGARRARSCPTPGGSAATAAR